MQAIKTQASIKFQLTLYKASIDKIEVKLEK